MRLRVAAVAGLLLLADAGVPASAEGLLDLFMPGAAPPRVEAPAGVGTLTVHRRQARSRTPRAARAARAPATGPKDARHEAGIPIDPAKVADWYLRDRTLRRGDIVVLKSGALVYKGRGGGMRGAADFARLRDARFLPSRTRDFVAKATAVNATAVNAPSADTASAMVAPPAVRPTGPKARLSPT